MSTGTTVSGSSENAFRNDLSKIRSAATKAIAESSDPMHEYNEVAEYLTKLRPESSPTSSEGTQLLVDLENLAKARTALLGLETGWDKD